MGLLEAPLDMSGDWPDWQSDTLRRVFENGALHEQDLVDLRAMLEQAEGALEALRLDVRNIPMLGNGQTIVLLELSNLNQVNRFAPGNTIQLNPQGLNIVFGSSGTGKPGYSRVLKRACRARRSAPVLPDTFAEALR